MFLKVFKFFLRHKVLAISGILLIAAGGYFGYNQINSQESSVRYLTAATEKGMLISSISGAGQVSASNQVDIKPKVSGDIVLVDVKNGQGVKEEDLIARVDSRDAQKEVRDAKTALETAQLELEKLLSPPDELDILQAENAVATAKRNLEELINPNESTLSQAENALISAQDTLTKLKFSQTDSYRKAVEAEQKAEDNLEKAYEDAFNTIANTFLDLPAIKTGLYDILYSYEIANSEVTVSKNENKAVLANSILSSDSDSRTKLNAFISSAENDYKTARTAYNENYEHYKDTSRYSDKDVIEQLLEETLETVRAMAETVKSEINMLDYWVDCRSQRDLTVFNKVTGYQSDLNSYTSKTNSHLSSLLSAQRSIEDYKEAILDAERDLAEIKQNQPLDLAAAERSVQEKEDALNKLKNPEQDEIEAAQIAVKEKELAFEELKAGADELDIRAKKITVQQKEEALLSAQQNLADYYIRAPFAGTLTEVNIAKGDNVSGSTVITTLITDQKIAEVTLNEIDVAQVKTEQKATLKFDAVEDLSITGEVVEVDTLGAVTQGVVSYGIKIAFDVQDERIKPGMSVSATIIIESKQNVLLAPISAVKTMGNSSYVEILINGQPQRQTVTTGSSNDTMIEIVDGLSEGDQVITQTITNNSQDNTSQNQGPQNMGGVYRMMR